LREVKNMNNVIELRLEAENVNDDGWEKVIDTLRDNLPGFVVTYGDGNYMTFSFNVQEEEHEQV
jgi:hypothetical protein